MRLDEGLKTFSAINVFKVRIVGLDVKKMLSKKSEVPTMICRVKTWVKRWDERQKLDVNEIKYLPSVCGVSR